MSIHRHTRSAPGHIHRPRLSAPSLKQQAAESQAKSLNRRKPKPTLPKAPWAKEAQS